VRQLAFAIIHSTTIALPAWHQTCYELGLKAKLIPRDVVTRWNSTYDMMKFVLAYREAIDMITANKTLKLRRYELDNDDWVIVEDLVSVLEVRRIPLIYYKILILYCKDIQEGHTFFLEGCSQYRSRHTCYGQTR